MPHAHIGQRQVEDESHAIPLHLRQTGICGWGISNLIVWILNFFDVIFILTMSVRLRSSVLAIRVNKQHQAQCNFNWLHTSCKYSKTCRFGWPNDKYELPSQPLYPGDSIVRRIYWHDGERFSIEQQISVCLVEKGKGWVQSEGRRIDDEKHRQASMRTFKLHKKLVDEHASELRMVLGFIVARGQADWPKVTSPSEVAITQKSALALELDFRSLIDHAESLIRQCDDDMEDIRNGIIVSEAQKAVLQQLNTTRLTLLAFFFIPLSLTTSFFGMNFNELGGLSIWVYFAATCPFLSLALIVCFWPTIHPHLETFLQVNKSQLIT
ncbi:hypothetical protein DL98DRAFT_569804 [Cadophora sp. DSE1049]|nr:hypothetical protein DL98DRAFT_569804 [Cadophora sp. DSE1049]